jgi:hypothetical protein
VRPLEVILSFPGFEAVFKLLLILELVMSVKFLFIRSVAAFHLAVLLRTPWGNSAMSNPQVV